jgi:dTMP kinase
MAGFIVLEGLNGAGKSTLSKLLADRIGGVYVSTPPDSLLLLRPAMDGNASLLSRYHYYMLGNALVSDQIREMRKTQFVVCDRFVYSTIARHSLLGLHIDHDTAIADIEVPDINIFVNVSDEAERISRIDSRGKRTKWDELDADTNMREKYLAFFHAKGFVFLETSHQSVSESLSGLMAELAKQGIVG